MMSGVTHLAPGEVHCWSADLDVPPGTSARLYAILAAEERSRSERFRYERDRRRFIVAHGVLRGLLGRYLETQPSEIAYVYNAFGKPDLGGGGGSRLKFNLSHSGDLALIAIAPGSNVGVDLESIQARSDYPEIARCFFSSADLGQLNAYPPERYAEAFLGCWTRKEAYLKARGVGLAVPLDSFSVPTAPGPASGPVGLDVTANDSEPARRWSFYALQPAPGHIGALAIEGTGWRLRQWQLRMLPD